MTDIVPRSGSRHVMPHRTVTRLELRRYRGGANISFLLSDVTAGFCAGAAGSRLLDDMWGMNRLT
jgi:hypothetical protein